MYFTPHHPDKESFSTAHMWRLSENGLAEDHKLTEV
jgi:hypothetical protein